MLEPQVLHLRGDFEMTENGKAPWADCESRETAYKKGQDDLVIRIEEQLARLWVWCLEKVFGKKGPAASPPEEAE